MGNAEQIPDPGMESDAQALREKYRQERDKRLRPDGNRQYIETTGEFARYFEVDPYVEPGFTRERLNDEIEVAIIGGGFCGLLAGARLREAGITGVRIIEAGGDFGGTWYWNRYPGCQCDVESYIYLPLIEELGYMPREKYAYATEIFEHSQRIGRAYGLYENTLFETRVTELRWDQSIRRWIVRTNRDDAIKARFVIMAAGAVSKAKLPGVPGIETFEGHSFHTTRWDYDYTGGDTTGNLHKLGDKRVAIIGTGATAIQCVPFVGQYAKHTYVFQRTPSSVDLRGNKPTDPEWVKSLKPGWQRRRAENFAEIISGRPVAEDLVNDGWTDIFRNNIASGFVLSSERAQAGPEDIALRAELADFAKMNRIRARVDQVVENEEVAEALKPWYRLFCKRPTFNDEYLPTFNRLNVTLVDVSAAKGVERITKKGVVANGVEYEVDCIIYATGFETTGAVRSARFQTYGRDGQSLAEYYANGLRTLHGHSTSGFPNWFFIGVGQNALSANMTSMFDDQAKHLAYIIKEVRSRGAVVVEATPEAEQAWVETIRSLAGNSREFLSACTPGYYNNEGDTSAGGLLDQVYTPGINQFNGMLAEWREKGDLEGLRLYK
jgi:cyclohexanone monooxygenase